MTWTSRFGLLASFASLTTGTSSAADARLMRPPVPSGYLALTLMLFAAAAGAGEPAAPPPTETAKAKKPPYSLPWQLRPVVPGSVVRSDTAFQSYEPKGADSAGMAIASTLLFSYKVTDSLAPLVRLGLTNNDPPEPSALGGGSALLNPVIGALYGVPLSDALKLGLFLGIALPLGTNGGDDPDPEKSLALATGMAARGYMDNAMFAVNYLTVFPGVGVAYVANGLTAQAEVTVLQLQRVKGDKVEKDSSKTNLTSGLHVGYFVLPQLSVGAELRYQRWLSTPEAPPVEANAALRDNLSMAVGPRLHLRAGDSLWLRPGVAYARFLDKPQSEADSNHIIQLDIPVAF